jgi:RNA polymerase sigma-70 factor (ECF subfamily)
MLSNVDPPGQKLEPLPLDDEALLERIREQDGEAFVVLYTRYARYLAGVVYRLLGTDDEVDDILQESFVDAMQGINRLRDAASLRWWLVTIAVRRVQRVLSSRQRRHWMTSSLSKIAPTNHVPAVDGSASDIKGALDALPAKLRVPWVLSRIEEQELTDIAAGCSISVATAKRRIALAEERLRRRLDVR